MMISDGSGKARKSRTDRGKPESHTMFTDGSGQARESHNVYRRIGASPRAEDESRQAQESQDVYRRIGASPRANNVNTGLSLEHGTTVPHLRISTIKVFCCVMFEVRMVGIRGHLHEVLSSLRSQTSQMLITDGSGQARESNDDYRWIEESPRARLFGASPETFCDCVIWNGSRGILGNSRSFVLTLSP
ncbi:hypothetical protein L2E82_32008 [Cichorium intybus]|uniref:Uncharacterized protein n=1 Tax=Cichorium intybus TaxID=13427 RepID=A0ACB9BF50_CICIN|nr:hypothetical protein L2E82_32008 [Cichorium intybus]